MYFNWGVVQNRYIFTYFFSRVAGRFYVSKTKKCIFGPLECQKPRSKPTLFSGTFKSRFSKLFQIWEVPFLGYLKMHFWRFEVSQKRHFPILKHFETKSFVIGAQKLKTGSRFMSFRLF